MKILCIDDEPTARVIYSAGLRDHMPEAEVDIADSAESAWPVIDANRYDVIITDLQMPGGSGIDVVREVRRAPCATQVLVVTGHAWWRSAVAAMQEGAWDYIQKPIDIPLLVAKIRKISESAASSASVSPRNGGVEDPRLRERARRAEEAVGAALEALARADIDAARRILEQVHPRADA